MTLIGWLLIQYSAKEERKLERRDAACDVLRWRGADDSMPAARRWAELQLDFSFSYGAQHRYAARRPRLTTVKKPSTVGL